jgi:hypothetical protein
MNMNTASNPEVPAFTLLWNNRMQTMDRTMNQHRFQIRDLLPGDQDSTLWDLHLDQMIVTFNTPEQMPSGWVYPAPDALTRDFDTVLSECMVAFSPCGASHVLYVENGAQMGPDAWNVISPLRYSMALVQSNTDPVKRIYRPIREAAVALGLPMVQGSMPPVSIEVLWPQLQGSDLVSVPDYRIRQIICNFSCRRR